MGRRRGYVAFLFFLSVAATIVAQESPVLITPRPSRGSADRKATIRVDSNLVLVPVLVTDRNERLITGLSREHFQIFDDKIEQQITQFSSEDTPISVVMVFDCSGSMGEKLRRSRMAAAEFLKTANPEDEFALVTFNDTVRLVSRFGDPPEEMLNRLSFIQSKGQTALLDAVYLAMNQMRHAKYSRRAILVISDGGDNSSRYTEGEVKQRAREADVQIFSVGIMEPVMARGRTPEEMSGAALLDEISKMTGGRMYEIDDINQLTGMAAQLSRALRCQYVLGYSPSSPRDGKLHRITVKLVRTEGSPKLKATFRPSYIAPEE